MHWAYWLYSLRTESCEQNMQERCELVNANAMGERSGR